MSIGDIISSVFSWVIGLVLGTILVFLLFIIVCMAIDDIWSVNIDPVEGIVLSLHYTPSQTSVGVGPAVGSNGGGVATTVSSTSEEWVVIVKIGDDVEPIGTTKQIWSELQKGDVVTISRSKGYFGGVELEDIIRYRN